jgi:hypothetical protein
MTKTCVSERRARRLHIAARELVSLPQRATGVAREQLRQEVDETEAKWRDADLSLERLRTENGQAWREMKKRLGVRPWQM